MNPNTTWPTINEQLLTDSAETFNFQLGTPIPLAVTPDGAVIFSRTPARSFTADLFELRHDGEVIVLATIANLLEYCPETLSQEEKSRRERKRNVIKGIIDIDLSSDGRIVMVPLGELFFLIDRITGKVSKIDPQGPAYDPHMSPNGEVIAFVRDGSLWVTGPGLNPQKLTYPPIGHEDGIADFAAQEQFGRTRGFWWSPDSTQIAMQRSDKRDMDTIYVADSRHPERPPVPTAFARAGRPNAKVQVGIVTLTKADGKIQTITEWLPWNSKYEYLASVTWNKGGPLTTLVLNRDQRELAISVYDPGERNLVMLFDEYDDAWLNVDVGAPTWLLDGTGMLWMTESNGNWVLQLRNAQGILIRDLTTPGFGLRKLVGVELNAAIVIASKDPTHQDIWRISLEGGLPERLSNGNGVVQQRSKVLVQNGLVVYDISMNVGGREVTVISPHGRFNLPSVCERPMVSPTTKLETVELEGRTHHVAITRPQMYLPGLRYPVLLKVYGGPQLVTVEAALDIYVMDQLYADAGFIVVRSDNRGTPNRGRDWERSILNDLISIPLNDQVATLQALGVRHSEFDMSRIGVFGWSFGGYFAAMAVLLRPDVFKAAIAGAPVTDWTLYDTAYTERYMKMPSDNVEGYRLSSTLTFAKKLERPLLIIHGITDDNVHFAHTLALSEALFMASKRAEIVTLPASHMIPDPILLYSKDKIQIDFFHQYLAKK